MLHMNERIAAVAAATATEALGAAAVSPVLHQQ